MNKIKILLALISLIFSTLSFAQVTSSGMSGSVTNGTETLPGATVRAIHEPSGTIYGAATNNEGRYAIQGMRPGGPYRVEVHYLGYADYVEQNLRLALGETFALNVRLSESEEWLEEVLVTGKSSKLTAEKTGVSTNISPQAIAFLPSIDRNMTDLLRLSPYASGMNFGGRDGRLNNFTVDGARLNNNFGLNSDLPGGGNPVSLDALEEIQITIAPYDVKQANFTGAGINAVTKSGTNQLQATAYTYLYNRNMRGNRIGNVDLGERDPESKNIYGVSLGGPLVKDKLFFFANLAYENNPAQITQWRPSKDGNPNTDLLISRTTEADLSEFSRLLKEGYGYDTGSFTDFPGGLTNLKFSGRLDWNIHAKHRLGFRYNYVEDENWMAPNGNTSEPNALNGNRISEYGLSYFNSCYATVNTLNTLTAELNSRLTNNMSNQLLITYTGIRQGRDTRSDPFPFIDILKDGKPYMSAGYELFTWNTKTTNQVFNVVDNYSYYFGNHKLTAGISYEYQTASTAYMSYGRGYYRYASFDDFKNKALPEAFALSYGYDGIKPAGVVSFGQSAAYLQDEWNIRDHFLLTAGIRFDHTAFLNDLIRNTAIYRLDFGGKQIDTGKWPDQQIQVSPRVGFSYDISGNQTFKLRGGSGIFTGRTPLVYLANMPVSGGMYLNSAVYAQTRGAYDIEQLEKLQALITTVPDMIRSLNLPVQIEGEGNVPSSIAGVDANFKMPQVWKSSLGIDYMIPVAFPLMFIVEGMYSKDLNAIRLINYNIKNTTGWEHFAGSDRRLIYPGNTAFYQKSNAYVLTNTSEGRGYTGNLILKATPVENLNLMLAYTHTESKEISGMPGSSASSAWQKVPSVNGPNFSRLERSQYVTPDRFIGSLTYRMQYGKKSFSTDVGLFYAGYSPYSYSYLYDGDMNGDGIANDLIYIPSDETDIRFKTQEDADLFWHFLENDKYLRHHRGEYAGAYAVNAPWAHRLDLKIAQNFAVKTGKTVNTLQVSVDILNVGNLLNSRWGVYKNMAPANNGKILKYEGKDENNVPVFSFFSKQPVEETFARYNSTDQTWKLQVGVRYLFN
jgi:hypothetical protein